MPALILIRGLPGSGKSTLAAKIVVETGAEHYEADQYFMRDDEYRYDPSKIKNAHAWCQNKTLTALQANKTVIVSNTFTTAKELRSYFEIAKSLGIVPEVIVARGKFKNIHGVPDDKLAAMAARWQEDISILYKE
jgi:adenylate kinase family enzyme